MHAQPVHDRVRVLRVIARLNIGGPSIHVTLLNTGLDRARFESLLIAGRENPGEASMLDYVLARGVRPFIIPDIVGQANLKPRDLRAIAALYRFMRCYQPHIVHTHTTKAGVVGRIAAWLAGVPIIIHTYHGHVLRGFYGPLKSDMLRRMEQLLRPITTHLVTVSEEIRHDLVHLGVTTLEHISAIPLGLELEPFIECHAQRGAFRRELGVSSATKLVGIISRLVPSKNHHLFLDAAGRVLAQQPDTHFVIIGDGVLRPQLEAYARSLGIADCVTFTGWRRDLSTIDADLDVLIVSSISEGTPVAAIEAMAAGVPVVATRVDGLPDMIKDDQTGYLVPSGNTEQLAHATLRLLENADLATRIGRAAQESVRERFAASRLVADMERLYLHLLQQRGILHQM